ncbi:hypothetical protein [Burkholderia vietnamiensis]|uniref:hypothetical protein n=1 Tax=Burkholderia vietnamiensis TaxID=60552 RepID=UPI001593E6A0|nr:hypothetical protein [Burkholderia vietnamiensis]
MQTADTSNIRAGWRVFIVHAVAKAVGVQFKFETLPFGARCHFQASTRGVAAVRGFNRASGVTSSSGPA